MGRTAESRQASVRTRLACLVALATLTGCRAATPMIMPAAFVIDPIGPAAAAVPTQVDALKAPAPVADAPATDIPAAVVRLHGFATIPTSVKDLANVQEGRVSGSPVRVKDARTGKLLAQGVTYYDGSFKLDVPVAAAGRAAIVTVAIVDRGDRRLTTALEAPVMFHAGLQTVEVGLSPGTTALTAFLTKLADVQARANASAQGPELGTLIAAFEPAAQAQFASLAEAAPEIRQAESLSKFEAGIQTYVGRLTGRMTEAPKPPTKTGAASADGL